MIIEPNALGLARRGAEIFSKAANKSFKIRGRFVVAISGGSTPRDLHRTLGEEPFRSNIPWEKTDIFWVDERFVPENDPASNYGAAMEDFLKRVPIPKAQIHPMPSEGNPEKSALNYQQELLKIFKVRAGKFPVFDLILLGIGTDGHTASLFPGQSALKEKIKWVVAVMGGNPNVSRLTMTYPLLNQAERIVFIASGREKAPILKAVLEDTKSRLPARMITPLTGELIWLLDQEAASLLSRELVHEGA
jgi:6-phosphogluconolactonase